MLTDPDATLLGRAPGLPDDAYDHDGLVTKRHARASALAVLRPLPGQLLWDIGTGAGSVGIEWCRTHPDCRALTVENKQPRADRAAGNIARLTLPGQVTQAVGDAVDVMRGWLEAGHTPDAVFFGGGVSDASVTLAHEALRPGGRLVVHGVTVETEAVCVAAHRRWGGELSRLAVENADRIGTMTGWAPLRTIVAWAGTRQD